MVQVPGLVAFETGVHDHQGVQPEHITVPESHGIVQDFPLVGHFVAYHLAHILDDNFLFLKRFFGK